MQQQLTQLRSSWGGVPRRAQIAIIGVFIATILVMFFVLRASTATDWVVVTSNLPAEKVGEAQTTLEEAGYEVRTAQNGTAIEVPSAVFNKASASLMTAGIAAKGHNGSCKEAFAEGGSMIAQTSDQHAVKLETCQEAQATNAIESIDGVEKATVDVTMPEKSLFSSETEAAKAAVFVNTAGNGLSKETVRGIQQSVAGSFKGLEAERVIITDETGVAISGDKAADEAANDTKKLQTEAEYNAAIERALTEKYEKIVGPGNIVITSNAELDLDRIGREVIEVGGEDNAQGPVSAEKGKNEVLGAAGTTGVEGSAGVATNTGVDPDNRAVTVDGTSTTNGDGSYLGNDFARTYDNDKVKELIDVAPGTPIRLRIGAVVDDGVDAAAAQAVKNNMQAWMGGNAQDSFSFDQAPLSASRTVDVPAPSQASAIAGYVKWFLLGMGIIGIALVLRRSLTQRTAELLAPADDLLMLDSGDMTPIPIAELEAALAAGQPSADRKTRIELQRKVEQIADAKPHDVANELRRWMHQDDQAYAPRKAG